MLGRVVGLWRYPVKSMAAEHLDDVEVSWFGLDGDRRWAFVRDGAAKSGFPWFTIRDRPDMGHFRPAFVDPSSPDSSAVEVRSPSGSVFDVADPALAAELAPDGARVMKQGRGIFDTFPLSLITTQTIASLGESVGRDLDVMRFRPNILVDADGDDPFPEDAWVGRVIRIGGVSMRIDKRDGRCKLITVDPTTSERDARILRAVAEEREGCLGVYGTTVEPGRLAMGDDVTT